MLRMDYEDYDRAAALMAEALIEAEEAGMRTNLGRALIMLEALGADFDVSAVDPGPDDDVASGNVWPRVVDEVARYNRDVLGAS